MLPSPTAFPLVGSYALTEHEGALRLARIVNINPDDSRVISLPERLGAGGNLTLPLADLIDGTPLDGAEQADLRALEGDLFLILKGEKRARTKSQKEQLARFNALAERRHHAGILAGKLAQHEDRQRAAREAA